MRLKNYFFLPPLFVLILALPIIVFISQQKQDIRQRAAGTQCNSTGVSKNPDGTYHFSQLKVSGGNIVDENGCVVYLRGFNTAGTEFGNAKGGMSQQTFAFFNQHYKMNIWRLSINVTWWNENVIIPDVNMHYQDWIKQVISWMEAQGAYVELNRVNQYPDSQTPPYQTLYPPCGGSIKLCPSQNQGSGSNPWQNNSHWLDETITFWKNITPLYKGDPAIIYNIWNEMPNVTDHKLWRDAEETLIQTVRGIVPNSVIIFGGPDYNKGIEPLTSGEVPDFTEQNLIFDYHIYSNYTKAWQNNAAFLRQDYQWVIQHNHGMMIGEWGHQTNSQLYQAILVQFSKDTASPIVYYDSWDVQSNGQLNANGQLVQQGYATLPWDSPTPTGSITPTQGITPTPTSTVTPTPTISVSSPTPTGILGNVTIDFGNRQNKTYAIPGNIFGVNGLGFSPGSMNTPLRTANISVVRTLQVPNTDIPSIFPTLASLTDTTQQNWSAFDTFMDTMITQGFTPLVNISYSPTWLQPSPNPCAGIPGADNTHVAPTNLQQWGQLAVQVVTHMDHKYPTLQPLYEIWNEPDGVKYLCTISTDQIIKRDLYKQIYATAAPLMKQQAQLDGKTIMIGGPALAYPAGHKTYWFPDFVTDPSTSPFIDFISYHNYTDVITPLWDNLLAKTQDLNTGVAAQYSFIAAAVYQGNQPNAHQTPIYIDEYNGGGIPQQNGIKLNNDPQYAPLWNSLFVSDMLDTLISSPNNSFPVPHFVYWSADNQPPGSLCLFGVLDTTYDCSNTGGTIQPYPQYYAYQLFGNQNYLNITDGGYIANTASSTISGVYTTGFFTNHLNNIVIVNTTATDFPALSVVSMHPASSATTANVYQIKFNASNPTSSIITQQVPLVQSSSTLTAAIHLPPYTAVALSYPSSVFSQTPTPTGNSGTSFLLTVCPHDLGNCGDNANPSGGNTNPLHTTRNITLTISDLNNTQIPGSLFHGQVTYVSSSQNFQGTVSAQNLSNRQYVVSIKMDGYLGKQIPSIITVTQGQQVTLPEVSLVTGDIGPVPGINNTPYGDNQLDITDYNVLISCYGDKMKTQSCLNPPTDSLPGADINDDGVVDGADYNEFLRELSVQKGG